MLPLYIIPKVILCTNSAFREILAHSERYFALSIVIYATSVILHTILLIPLHYTTQDTGVSVIFGILSGLLSLFVIYLIGSGMSGNSNAREYISVMFFAHIYAIPMFFALVILMLATTSTITPYAVVDPVGFIPLVICYVLFSIWGLVLLVKAVKIINDFGTLKAFLLLVVGYVVSALILTPFMSFQQLLL